MIVLYQRWVVQLHGSSLRCGSLTAVLVGLQRNTHHAGGHHLVSKPKISWTFLRIWFCLETEYLDLICQIFFWQLDHIFETLNHCRYVESPEGSLSQPLATNFLSKYSESLFFIFQENLSNESVVRKDSIQRICNY